MIEFGSQRAAQFDNYDEDDGQSEKPAKRRATLKPGQMNNYAFTNSEWQSSCQANAVDYGENFNKNFGNCDSEPEEEWVQYLKKANRKTTNAELCHQVFDSEGNLLSNMDQKIRKKLENKYREED